MDVEYWGIDVSPPWPPAPMDWFFYVNHAHPFCIRMNVKLPFFLTFNFPLFCQVYLLYSIRQVFFLYSTHSIKNYISGFWKTDNELLKNRWKRIEKLITSYWKTDNKLSKNSFLFRPFSHSFPLSSKYTKTTNIFCAIFPLAIPKNICYHVVTNKKRKPHSKRRKFVPVPWEFHNLQATCQVA